MSKKESGLDNLQKSMSNMSMDFMDMANARSVAFNTQLTNSYTTLGNVVKSTTKETQKYTNTMSTMADVTESITKDSNQHSKNMDTTTRAIKSQDNTVRHMERTQKKATKVSMGFFEAMLPTNFAKKVKSMFGSYTAELDEFTKNTSESGRTIRDALSDNVGAGGKVALGIGVVLAAVDMEDALFSLKRTLVATGKSKDLEILSKTANKVKNATQMSFQEMRDAIDSAVKIKMTNPKEFKEYLTFFGKATQSLEEFKLGAGEVEKFTERFTDRINIGSNGLEDLASTLGAVITANRLANISVGDLLESFGEQEGYLKRISDASPAYAKKALVGLTSIQAALTATLGDGTKGLLDSITSVLDSKKLEENPKALRMLSVMNMSFTELVANVEKGDLSKVMVSFVKGLQDNADKFREMPHLLDSLAESIGVTTNEITQLAFSNKNLAKELEGMHKKITKSARTTEAFNANWKALSETFTFQSKRIKNAVSSVFSELGTEILPTLTSGLNILATGIIRVVDNFMDAPPILKKVVAYLISMTSGVAGISFAMKALQVMGVPKILSIFDVFGPLRLPMVLFAGSLGLIITYWKELNAMSGGFLGEMLTQANTKLEDLSVGITKMVRAAMLIPRTLYDIFSNTDAMSTKIANMKTEFGMFFTELYWRSTDLGYKLGTMMENMKTKVLGFIYAIADELWGHSLFPDIIDWLGRIWESVKQTLSDSGKVVYDTVGKIWSKLMSLKGKMRGFWNELTSISFGGIWESVFGAKEDPVKKVQEMNVALVTTKSYLAQAADYVLELTDNLVKGINNFDATTFSDALASGISGLPQTIYDGIISGITGLTSFITGAISALKLDVIGRTLGSAFTNAVTSDLARSVGGGLKSAGVTAATDLSGIFIAVISSVSSVAWAILSKGFGVFLDTIVNIDYFAIFIQIGILAVKATMWVLDLMTKVFVDMISGVLRFGVGILDFLILAPLQAIGIVSKGFRQTLNDWAVWGANTFGWIAGNILSMLIPVGQIFTGIFKVIGAGIKVLGKFFNIGSEVNSLFNLFGAGSGVLNWIINMKEGFITLIKPIKFVGSLFVDMITWVVETLFKFTPASIVMRGVNTLKNFFVNAFTSIGNLFGGETLDYKILSWLLDFDAAKMYKAILYPFQKIAQGLRYAGGIIGKGLTFIKNMVEDTFSFFTGGVDLSSLTSNLAYVGRIALDALTTILSIIIKKARVLFKSLWDATFGWIIKKIEDMGGVFNYILEVFGMIAPGKSFTGNVATNASFRQIDKSTDAGSGKRISKVLNKPIIGGSTDAGSVIKKDVKRIVLATESTNKVAKITQKEAKSFGSKSVVRDTARVNSSLMTGMLTYFDRRSSRPTAAQSKAEKIRVDQELSYSKGIRSLWMLDNVSSKLRQRDSAKSETKYYAQIEREPKAIISPQLDGVLKQSSSLMQSFSSRNHDAIRSLDTSRTALGNKALDSMYRKENLAFMNSLNARFDPIIESMLLLNSLTKGIKSISYLLGFSATKSKMSDKERADRKFESTKARFLKNEKRNKTMSERYKPNTAPVSTRDRMRSIEFMRALAEVGSDKNNLIRDNIQAQRLAFKRFELKLSAIDRFPKKESTTRPMEFTDFSKKVDITPFVSAADKLEAVSTKNDRLMDTLLNRSNGLVDMLKALKEEDQDYLERAAILKPVEFLNKMPSMEELYLSGMRITAEKLEKAVSNNLELNSDILTNLTPMTAIRGTSTPFDTLSNSVLSAPVDGVSQKGISALINEGYTSEVGFLESKGLDGIPRLINKAELLMSNTLNAASKAPGVLAEFAAEGALNAAKATMSPFKAIRGTLKYGDSSLEGMVDLLKPRFSPIPETPQFAGRDFRKLGKSESMVDEYNPEGTTFTKPLGATADKLESLNRAIALEEGRIRDKASVKKADKENTALRLAAYGLAPNERLEDAPDYATSSVSDKMKYAQSLEVNARMIAAMEALTSYNRKSKQDRTADPQLMQELKDLVTNIANTGKAQLSETQKASKKELKVVVESNSNRALHNIFAK